jgi:hypothetical protein
MKRANRRLQITFLTTGNEDITATTKEAEWCYSLK